MYISLQFLHQHHVITGGVVCGVVPRCRVDCDSGDLHGQKFEIVSGKFKPEEKHPYDTVHSDCYKMLATLVHQHPVILRSLTSRSLLGTAIPFRIWRQYIKMYQSQWRLRNLCLLKNERKFSVLLVAKNMLKTRVEAYTAHPHLRIYPQPTPTHIPCLLLSVTITVMLYWYIRITCDQCEFHCSTE